MYILRMEPIISAVYHWLRANEALAMWVEGFALVLIFGLELLEYRRQGKDRKEAHEESVKQLNILQSQTDALVNSERAWLIAELVPIYRRLTNGLWARPTETGGWDYVSNADLLSGEHLKHKLRVTNMGRTPAHVLRFGISYRLLDKGVTTFAGKSVAHQEDTHIFDRLLPAGESADVSDVVHIHAYITNQRPGIVKLENSAVFDGWVEYLHIFNNSEVVRAPFRYVFKPSMVGLERVPEIGVGHPNL